MTLEYLQLARLNATPLSKHIDTPEQQAPVYTCIETLAADMMASAMETKRRLSGEKMSDEKYLPVADLRNEDILATIKANPGITTSQIAKRLGFSLNIVHGRLNTMTKRGLVNVRWVAGMTKNVRSFTIVENASPKRPNDKAPIRDALIDFLRTNPGCTTNEIAAHLGRSRAAVVATLKRARRVVTIATVHPGTGSHQPARYWVEDAQ